MKGRRIGVLVLLVAVASSEFAAREGRGWIGLAGQYEERGLVVQGVVSGSPAARAGLRAKDVITSIDGRAVADRDYVRAAFAGVKAAQEVRFVVLRENRLIVVRVKAALRPER
jgi:putative serine protease PepD